MKSPENVTGQALQSSAESKDISDPPQQSEPKAPNGTLPAAAETAPAQNEVPAANEPPTSKDQSVPEAAQSNWTQSEKYHFCLEVILAVIGLIALYVYYFQLEEMRKSTNAATRAAKAAEDSITLTREMSRLDQRAWVAPIAFEGIPEAGKPLTVNVEYKNSGKTFARNLQISFFAHTVAKGKEPNFDRVNDEPKGERSTVLLSPGAESASPRVFQPITKDEMKRINSGDLEFFIYGKMTYLDVFDFPHWTTFCARYNKNGYYTLYHKHNEADNDRAP